MSNLFNLAYSLYSHYSKSNKSSSIQDLLQKFDSKEEKDDKEDEEIGMNQKNEPEETPEDFETKKRQLLILLDQAVMTKMKITKAFPEKLKTFGENLVIFQNNLHFRRDLVLNGILDGEIHQVLFLKLIVIHIEELVHKSHVLVTYL